LFMSFKKSIENLAQNMSNSFFPFSEWLVFKEPDGKEKVKEKEKVKIMELVAKELANPERDCKKFDPGRVAYRE
jgi:hypothetical protein